MEENKIFLEHLPKWRFGRGQPNGVIDWGSSIGYKVKGIYKELEFEIQIIDYKNNYLYLKYLDKPIFKMAVASFKNCNLGKILGIITDDFKVKVGTIFKDDKRLIS